MLERVKRPKRAVVTAGMPYANGPVHIGHLAGAQLPADIMTRYLGLMLGRENVLFVCGPCHRKYEEAPEPDVPPTADWQDYVRAWKAHFFAVLAPQFVPAGWDIVSVKNLDKAALVPIARDLIELGFSILATGGTAKHLAEHGIVVERVNKVAEGRPHIVDAMKNGEVQLVFNTTEGAQSYRDSFSIRRTALTQNIPYYTTMSGARAAIQAIRRLKTGAPLGVQALQAYA